MINADDAEIRKELGDVLLHVLFYSKIAEEKGQFDIADVCDSLVAKLKFRHPHIYGDVTADNARQVAMNWEDIKLKERPQEEHRSVLDGVPSTLPALNKAFRIQEKAANAGFDWQNACEVCRMFQGVLPAQHIPLRTPRPAVFFRRRHSR